MAPRRRGAAAEEATPARGRRGGGKSSIRVDFTGVETSGKVAEGIHIAEVEEIAEERSENGHDYLKVVMKVEGQGKLYENLSLQPQALWKLRGFLEALGFDVPDKAMDIDFGDLIGEKIGVSVEHETYRGKKKARVGDVMTVEEAEEEMDKDDKPTRSRGRAADPDPEPAPRRRRGRAEEEEEEEPAPRSRRREPAQEEEPAPRRRRQAEPEPPPAEDLRVDDNVEFEDEGTKYKAVIVSIDKKSKMAVVKSKKGDEWEIELADLTLLD